MRLIIVHQDPSPTGGPEAICTLKLIHALADEGVDVDVVMRREPNASLLRSHVACFPIGTARSEGHFEKVRRLCNLYPESGWAWAEAAADKIVSLCSAHAVSAICSRAMPFISHVAVLKAKKQVDVPWVAHFSDPWPPDGYSEGRKYSNLRLRWHHKLAAVAEMITFPCERVARFCEQKQWGLVASQPRPVSLILAHIAGQFTSTSNEVRKQGDPIVFLHCGGFTEKRRPDEFLDAWASFLELHPEKRHKLKFKHVGPHSEQLSTLAREYGIADSIEQVGPCAYSESLTHMASATALVLIDSYKIKTSVYFPSKLSDYVGAGKPVLAMSPEDGTVADLLGNAYPLRANPWDKQQMVAALDRTLDAIEERGSSWSPPIAALREMCAPATVARTFVRGIESLYRDTQERSGIP